MNLPIDTGRRVLVVAAHPDDEVLGCGGTMAWHRRRGDSVHVLICAEGATSRADARDTAAFSGALSELAGAAHTAGKIVGASSVRLHAFPDNRMDSVDLLDVVKVIESAMRDVRPST